MRRVLTIYRLIWQADRRTLLVVLSLMPVAAVATVAASYALKLVIDAAVAADSRLAVWAVALATLALGIAPVLMHVQHVLQRLLSDKLSVEMERNALVAVASIPGVEYAERPEYLDWIELILDQGQDLAASVWSLSDLIITTLRLLLGALLLAFIHPLLALLPALAVPVIVLTWRARRAIAQAERAAAEPQRMSRALTSSYLDHTTLMQIKVFGAAELISDRARQMGLRAARIRFAAGLRSGWLICVGWVIFGLGFAGAFLLATEAYLTGRATIGDFVLVWQLALSSLPLVQNLLANLQRLFRSMEVFEHLDWLASYAHAQEQAWDALASEELPSRLLNGLRLRNVGFHYPGSDRPVLSDISLDLEAGAVVALVGENGAGKSSLTKLLLGHYRPSAGEITLDGLPLSSYPARTWQQSTSATHQDYARIEALLRQTVGLGDVSGLDDTDRLTEAIEGAAATDFTAPLVEGLETHIGKTYRNGIEPSGGQWQRLATARSFMPGHPLLLVLDEPTNAIDPLRERELLERYARVASAMRSYGGILVIVSHRFSTVRMADKIVVLEGGRIVEEGSHAALMKSAGRYAHQFDHQAAAFAGLHRIDAPRR